MRRGGHRGSSLLVWMSLAFAVGILTAVFLPDILIIVLLTILLVFLSFMLLK